MGQDDGGAAFPCAHDKWIQHGMTLRDYFAGQALTGLKYMVYDEHTAAKAYALADAMLEERAK